MLGGMGGCTGHMHILSPQGQQKGPSCACTHTHINTQFNYRFIGQRKVDAWGEDERYRISNGPGMKRFLIFRLAAFQWTGALSCVQALIPAPGSIIGVSCGSLWLPHACCSALVEETSQGCSVALIARKNKANPYILQNHLLLDYNWSTFKENSGNTSCMQTPYA